MNTVLKMILLSGLIFLSPVCSAFSQTVGRDSCIILGPSEIRVLTKMTEDLRYTKKELQICDSLGVHKDKIIDTQKSVIIEKDKMIETGKKKAKKIGLISGGLSFIIGLILGGLI